ncbi:carbon-nitrogen hydrolase family protein [Amycolatopsis balhimycina DSM 5908]|uniref:Carbon-nitrogen hydrolase family protein n=1 Tax=Amycolatopsis balhimycina DSM 5908 TaxID=1081091 RepID=A0A428X612_AMYBA|nr:carbon-nitrogen hydrolase family protein [Amycolatopsis balhimycina]RSM50770.1 carbon-nitrogen hydrolase family protein [Amycolatopsis balhimycina DSM 5908]
MGLTRIATAAAHFGRDLTFDLSRVAALAEEARGAGAAVLVLPDGTLGGSFADFGRADPEHLPPALAPDGPEVREVANLAAELVVCFGYTEAGEGGERYSAAACVTGDGLLGRHRKVYLSAAEALLQEPGSEFTAFDTPAGRLGMLLDYEKAVPEPARGLALDGASIIACLCSWATSSRAPTLTRDRQARLFDVYDCVRAVENQVVLASANQAGVMHGTRFLGLAKVVGPDGTTRARTGSRPALVVAEVDVDAEITTARRARDHLGERRPEAYSARRPKRFSPL